METSRLPMTLFCIIAFIAFEVAVGQEASGLADALGWTVVNAVCCIALWLFADAHIEIGDVELGDLLATGYHPNDPRHPRDRNMGSGDDRLYPQVVMDTVGRSLIMLHSSDNCYASPFSEN